jgi:ubiquinone biosynthesis protein COQ9
VILRQKRKLYSGKIIHLFGAKSADFNYYRKRAK